MTAGETTPVLEVQGLCQRFGGVAALDDVSFNLLPGERVGIIGPNGAGKTTLVNCLLSSPGPARGRVVFQGQDVTNRPTHSLVRMGFARSFQLVNIFPSLTVLENMMLALGGRDPRFPFRLRRRRLAAEDQLRGAAVAALDGVGLLPRAGTRAGDIAHGEQRRLDLIMALQGSPAVVLLDEPSAGLTTTERAQVLELVRAHTRASVLIIDHDLDTIFGLAGRIIGMYQGRVIAEGTAEQVRRSPVLRRAYFGE